MRFITSVAAFTMALGLSACGDSDENAVAPDASPSDAPTAGQMQMGAQTPPAAEHSATGTVTAVEGDRVTIDHGPVESIGRPAMTMSFAAPRDGMAGIEPGDRVAFTFRQEGPDQVVTSITPQP